MREIFSRRTRARRRANSLAETLAGTALLGGMLVGILTAHARMTVQTGRAGVRVEACRVADELLAAWWLDLDKLPREAAGPAGSHPGWTWRTQRVKNDTATALDAEAVRLSIYAPGQSGSLPAASVEFLVANHAK